MKPRYMRPQLCVDLDKKVDGCYVQCTASVPDVRDDKKEARFFRLRVKNTTRFVANDVRAYLSKVEKWAGEAYVPSPYTDSLRLAWSWERVLEENRTNPKTKGISLFLGHYDYVDICSTYRDYSRVFLGLLYYPEEYKSLLDHPGRYRLSITVVGDNADPRDLRIIVIWTGKWNEVKVVSESWFRVYGHQITA
ncbi:MAG: hypothetical protein U0791_21905 [Gemmataceae bacterium]